MSSATEDRRRLTLTLSRAGKRALTRADALLAEQLGALLEDLPRPEADALARALPRVEAELSGAHPPRRPPHPPPPRKRACSPGVSWAAAIRCPCSMATPAGLTDLSAGSWKGAFKRTRVAFKQDKLTDWAAALTYYGVLAIFPALLVAVSVLGLIGDSATNALLDNLEKVAPGPAQEILENAITNLQGSQGASGVALVIGLGAAVWASSSYVNGFMSASNSIYDVDPASSLTKTCRCASGSPCC